MKTEPFIVLVNPTADQVREAKQKLEEYKRNQTIMTLQEAKEIVAKGRGYDDWKEVEDTLYGSKLIAICDDAAETYARAKWDQACEAQKSSCSFSLSIHSDILVYPTDFPKMHERIMNAPKPEFKP